MSQEDLLAKVAAQLEKVHSNQKSAAKSQRDLTESIGAFVATGSQSVEKVNQISTAYEDMQQVLSNSTKITGALSTGLGALTAKLTFLGPVAKGAGVAIAGIGKAFGGLANVVAAAPKAFITALDDQTRGLRQFESEMFDLNKRFGGTIDEAQDFANAMRMASDNDLAKSLHLTTNEMAGFVRATRNTSLTQEQLSQTVQTGAGTIELFGAATAFAEASSMSFNEAAGLMNTLMNKQGKSAQEATNMLGMYVGVAEETGLSIDKVASSLNSAVSQFAKIGMAADFGKPIMEGFSKTMTDMGLGIEESIALSEGLTRSLAGLTNNYGMAYLTFQRGGLDIGGGGGGGVLGSSIALQSAYLEAGKTNDQAAISDQLVKGMRDTLASFTGGDIVTVQQANQDSSLQSQFYMQQQMLKNNFGISDDNSAARVLDMLSQLDDANKTGDVDAQKKLKEQIEKEKKGRNETLDEMEKVNRKLETQINIMTVSLRNDLDQTRRIAASTGRGIAGFLPGAVGTAGAGISKQGEILKRMADWLGLEKGSKAEKALTDDWNSHVKNNPLQQSGPMNKIVEPTANRAVQLVRREGAKEAEGLLKILAHALGRKDNKFAAGSSVTHDDIDRVAMVIAAQSTTRDGESVKDLARQLSLEFKEGLKDMKVTVGVTKEAHEAGLSAKALTKSAKNIGTDGAKP